MAFVDGGLAQELVRDGDSDSVCLSTDGWSAGASHRPRHLTLVGAEAFFVEGAVADPKRIGMHGSAVVSAAFLEAGLKPDSLQTDPDLLAEVNEVNF